MEKLKTFLSLDPEALKVFAVNLGVDETTVRGWISGHRKPNALMAIRVEACSYWHIKREDVRPDLFGKKVKGRAADFGAQREANQ